MVLAAAVLVLRPQSLRIGRRELAYLAWLEESLSAAQLAGGVVLAGIVLAQTAR